MKPKKMTIKKGKEIYHVENDRLTIAIGEGNTKLHIYFNEQGYLVIDEEDEGNHSYKEIHKTF